MGAWTDLTLAVATLQGLASVDWPASSAQVDVDTSIVAQAKSTVVSLATPRLAAEIVAQGGSDAFFDLVAAESKLSSQVQTMLGYAYLHHSFFDRAPTSTGVLYEKALRYYNTEGDNGRGSGLLVNAVKGFALTAPATLGQSTRPTGSGTSAAFASTMDRYQTS